MTKWLDEVLILSWLGVLAIVANSITFKASLADSAIGMLLLILIALGGRVIGAVIPAKIPVVCWIALLGLAVTGPLNPYGELLDKLYLSKINFLSIATAILTYAGLAVGKDLKMFQQQSWRIVIVALLVFTGTFVFSTIIAEFMLRASGVI